MIKGMLYLVLVGYWMMLGIVVFVNIGFVEGCYIDYKSFLFKYFIYNLFIFKNLIIWLFNVN